MLELEFESFEEVVLFFRTEHDKVARATFDAIKHALETKEDTAYLFDIYVGDSEYFVEISLEKESWEQSMESVLQHFDQYATADETIDAWQLLQEVKKLEIIREESEEDE